MTNITGTSGGDTLAGTDGADVINGGDGNDSIYLGQGRDVIDGGAGYDYLYAYLDGSFFSPATGAQSYLITMDHVSSSSGALDTTFSNIERVALATGNNYNNIIDASSAGFNVWLTAGTGNDRITGGAGDDYLAPGGGADVVDGRAGADVAYLYYAPQTAGIVIDNGNTGAVNSITIGGVAAGSITNVEYLSFYGGNGNDVVTGGSNADGLDGGGGDDILHAGDGDDTLSGGQGADLLDGGAGTDIGDYRGASSGVTVDLNLQGMAQNTGGDGLDTLISIENIYGSNYADILIGDGNANSISDLNGGNDQITGNGGADYLSVNRYDGIATTVALSGGSGDDILSFYGYTRYSDAATLDGGDGNDVILTSGLGSGTINGGSGNDHLLIDSLGDQYTITLGTGSDQLALAGTAGGFRAASAITVTDFATGAGGDVLSLSTWLSGGALINLTGGSNPFLDGHLRLLQSGSSTLLQADRNGGGDSYATLITFQNTSATAFAAANLGGFSPVDAVNVVVGTSGSDSLSGTVGRDNISGGDGSDVISLSAGHDVIDGGGGDNDYLDGLLDGPSFARATAARTYTISADHVSDSSGTLDTSFTNIESVSIYTADNYGNTFDASGFKGAHGVSLYSGSGADRMTGSAADDYLSPGLGNNIVDGGGGSDQLYLDFSSLTASVGLNNSNSAGINAIFMNGIAAGSITNVETLSFYGGAGNDIVHGGSGNDSLSGGAGSDLLDGGAGTDLANYLDAASGVTVDLNIQGVAQNTGGSGSDTLISIENLYGSAYSDILTGDGNANAITDLIGGNDQIFGKDGADYISVSRSYTDATTVALFGGAGGDNLSFYGGTRYSDTATLDGGDGSDAITARGLGVGAIFGGSGNDQITIDTLGGQYTIALGTGSDRLTLAGTAGGFRAASAITVTDFATGNSGDVLSLSDWLSDGALTNVNAGANLFLDGHLRLLQSGTSTLLQADRNGGGDSYATLITFQNTTAVAFTATNLGGLAQNDQINVVTGTSGDDYFFGSVGNDDIRAGEGYDTIYLSSGHDIVDGGGSYDSIYAYLGSSAFQPSTGARIYTITADHIFDNLGILDTSFSSVEYVSLSTADDFNNIFDASGFTGANGVALSGGSGDDLMTGSAGDDYLSPGAGNNILDGGKGRDTANLSFSSQTAGINLDNSNAAAVNTIYSGGVAAGSITNIEILNFYGSAGGDTVTGGTSNDTISGQAGDDTLRGGGGNDWLAGGAGSDLLDGGAGSDTADYSYAASGVSIDLGLQGVAQATGGSGNDTLISIEQVFGSSYSDSLTGDDNANSLEDFAGGDDQFFGKGGDDYFYISRYSGTATTVMVSGGTGNDIISFSSSPRYIDTATLDGGDGADSIEATGLGAGVILGGNGNDRITIDTLGGQYTISLGSGSDTLTLADTAGGFRAGSAITLTDFETGKGGDLTRLSDWLSGGALTNYMAGADPFTDGHLRLLQSGTAALLQVDRDGGGDSFVTLITYQNVAASSFVASNFGGYVPVVGLTEIIGSDVGETLTGTSGDEVIKGLGGDDVLLGSTGNDILDGGAGIDTVSYASATAGVLVSLASAVQQNTVSAGLDRLVDIEKLIGSAFDDTLTGNSDANALNGGGGNDMLIGGGGNDLLDGGAGIDTASYADAAGGVKFSLSIGAAQDTLSAGIDTLTGIENLIGSAFNDTLSGNADANLIEGGAGDDGLLGNGGNDILRGGDGKDQIFANDGDDIISGGADDDYLNGNAGNDVVTGDAGNDTLRGEGGVDRLDGGSGNDNIAGGDGDDVLIGGLGNDYIDGGAGIDTASYVDAAAAVQVSLALTAQQNTGSAGLDTLAGIEHLVGSGFGDTLTGNAGANSLAGGAGDDVLAGGAGDDMLDGGAGSDTVSYADATASIRVSLMIGSAQDTLAAGLDTLTGIENLTGSAFGDTLTGNAGANVINGGAGDDILVGGLGDDSLDGGAGVDTASYADVTAGVQISLALTVQQTMVAAGLDTLVGIENLAGSAFNDVLTGNAGANSLAGGAGDDMLSGGAGDDVLDGGNGIDTASYADAGAAVQVSLLLDTVQNTLSAGLDRLTNIENLTGSAFDDTLTGNAGANALTGGGGNDMLSGGSGDDLLDGGAGIDTASYADAAGGVKVSLSIGSAQNTLSAGLDTLTGIENLTGSAFNDTLSGNADANLIEGGAGDDGLLGNGGNDILRGGDGKDQIFANDGDDIISGGADDDYLNGNAGNDVVTGDAGNDTLRGEGGVDRLDGGNGNDNIAGGDGDDVLIGGLGNDYIDGGAGNDSASLDFSDRTGDVLLVNGGIAGTAYAATVGGVAAGAVANVEALSIVGGSGNDRIGSVYMAVPNQPLHAALIGNDGFDTAVIDATGLGGSVRFTGGIDDHSLFNNDGGDVIQLSGIEVLEFTGNARGIRGGAGNDRLTGLGGDDYFDGGAGDDILSGGRGQDVLIGGTGNNIIDGGPAEERNGYISFDTASFDFSDRTGSVVLINGGVMGTVYAATVDGVAAGSVTNVAYVSITGGSGNDRIGGAFHSAYYGGVELNGNGGIDTAVIDTSDVPDLHWSGGLAPFNGFLSDGEAYSIAFTGIEILEFTGDARNEIWGGNLGDTLTGLGGDDIFHGGEGADRLTGNAGNDMLSGDGGNDVIEGGAGNDLLDGGAGTDTVSYAQANAGVTVTLAMATSQNTVGAGFDTVIGFENLAGSAFADVLIGDANANVISGGDGNDIILGGAGNDVLTGGTGIDTVSYSDATNGVRVSLAILTAQGTAAGGTDTLSGFENLTGSNFGDQLTGDAGNNIIRGGLGNDTIDGGDGDDLLIGGAGSDKLAGGNGIDTASYEDSIAGVTVSLAIVGTQGTIGSGTETLSGIENLTGSAFADKLTGDAGNNIITGGDGNDILNGGAGNDTLNGGMGFDIASYAGATNGVKVILGITTPQLTAAGGKDTLISIEGVEGGSFGDQLTGSAGDDVIYGRDGNDTIVAGDGNDLVLGGTGSDNMTGGNGIDTASYEDAVAAVTVSLAITTQQGTGGSGNDTLTGFENLTGSNFNDKLTGDAGANAINGGAGHDTIIGGLGDDILDGGLGTDTASYADAAAGVTVSLAITGIQSTIAAGSDILSGFENLTGSAFADILSGDAGANKIDGGAGNDHVDGGAGDDIILASLGDDMLAGGDGIDTLSYEDATSAVVVSLALGLTGQATGPSGFDTFTGFENLTGSAFADTLTGDNFANVISGGAANDKLFGGLGDDTLLGGSGSDLLTGGAGIDTLTGGTSGDRFILTSASESAVGQNDVITDFSHAEKDRIDVSGVYGGTFNFLGSNGFTGHAGELHYGTGGTGLFVAGDIDGDGVADFEIKLIGITTMEAADFVL